MRNTKKNDEGRKAVSRRSPVKAEAPVQKQASGKSQAALKAEAAQQKVVGMFHPAVIEWMKDNLGVDVADRRVPVGFKYDLLQNKMTEPTELVVTPLAYDRERKENVAMPRMKVVASLRMTFPYEDGKMVAPDKDHRIFVATVPCRPLLEKADSVEMAAAARQEPVAEETKDQEMPRFSESQAMALEGVGINRERLYGGYNHLGIETKKAILAGDIFEVDGAVKTSFGFVNVIGTARMRTGADGAASMQFETTYPEARDADKVLDILAARRIGTLELDFFDRFGNGRTKTDVNGVPLVNEAARNLLTYGEAMMPVTGYKHSREYDKKTKTWHDVTEKSLYQVTVVNGNLYASEMKQVPDLNPDGTKVTHVDADGKEVTSMHAEVPFFRMKDGKAFIDGETSPLAFKTPEDRESYLRGEGGVVVGATYHDFKQNKDVKYDAFVVASSARAGFGRKYTPSVSLQLIEARKARQERKNTARRKQNFGIGF